MILAVPFRTTYTRQTRAEHPPAGKQTDDGLVVVEYRPLGLVRFLEADEADEFEFPERIVDVLDVSADEPGGLADTRRFFVADCSDQLERVVVERSRELALIPRASRETRLSHSVVIW